MRGIKIAIEIATKPLRSHFLSFFTNLLSFREEGRGHVGFHLRSGWVGVRITCLHTICPFPVPLSPSRQLLPYLAPGFPSDPIPSRFSTPPSLDRRSLSLSPLSLTVDSPDSRLSIPVSLSPSSVITRLLPAPLSPRSLRNSRLVQWLNLTATALERPERSQQSFFPPCPAGRKASWPYRSPPQPNALVSLRTLHEKA